MEDGLERAVKLSLIKKSEKDLEGFYSSLEDILKFVGEISKIETKSIENKDSGSNVFREDVVSVPKGKYTKMIVDLAPKSHKKWIVTKKIL